MPYLTPDAAAGDTVCRRFAIPVELLHIFMGALDLCTYDFMYEQDGTLTPAETASLFREVIENMETTPGDCVAEIGMVCDFYGEGPGADWLVCNGALFNRVDYPLLYESLSNVSSTLIVSADTFRTPDRIGKFSLGGITASQNVSGGAATHVLTTAEMPAHNHSVQDPGTRIVQTGTASAVLSDPGLASTTGNRGGGGAHNNMPPYNTATPYIRAR